MINYKTLNKEKNLEEIKKQIKFCIFEDMQNIGDITSDNLIPNDYFSNGYIFTKEDCVFYGKEYIEEVFRQIDDTVELNFFVENGDILKSGDKVVQLNGKSKSILKSERISLNFIGHLSGISTITNNLTSNLKQYKTTISCTRKTTPLLRNAEKIAVACGGGGTHRFGLYDAVMIKDNHIAAYKSIADATIDIMNKVKDKVIEVEVDTVEQFIDILELAPNVILLDNMKYNQIRECVKLRNEKGLNKIVLLEASGNITPSTVEEYCKCDVDIISMGFLTHSTKNIDFSLVLEN